MILIANHKMYENLTFTLNILSFYANELNGEVIAACNSLFLDRAKQLYTNISAQDCSEFDNGAHTSEISAKMLSEFDILYSLIGHSETRDKYNNTSIFAKLNQALSNNITPILCVGERNHLNRYEELNEQLNTKIDTKTIIAYEPVWAIGTNVIPTNKEIDEVASFIKSNHSCKVLYGGSVNANNINSLIECNNIDGFLIGRSSLFKDEMRTIYKAIK